MQYYPDSQVMLCEGHGARAHTKHLGKLGKQKNFSCSARYIQTFPDVLTVKYHCPKWNSK